jgi:hypothetical protein
MPVLLERSCRSPALLPYPFSSPVLLVDKQHSDVVVIDWLSSPFRPLFFDSLKYLAVAVGRSSLIVSKLSIRPLFPVDWLIGLL